MGGTQECFRTVKLFCITQVIQSFTHLSKPVCSVFCLTQSMSLNGNLGLLLIIIHQHWLI